MPLSQVFVKIPLHPLYFLVLGLIGGILIGAYGSTESSITFAVMVGIALFFLALSVRAVTPQKIIITLLAIAGFVVIGALRVQQKSALFDQFYRTASYGPCTVVAKVMDAEYDYKHAESLVLTLRIKDFIKKEQALPSASGFCFRLSIKKDFPSIPRIGDTIALTPLYFRAPPDNEYKQYLLREGIVAQLKVFHTTIYTLKQARFSLKRICFELRNNVIERIRPTLSPMAFTLFASVFLGKKAVNTKLMGTIRDRFKPWGILHHLARAGLHMMVLVMVLQRLLGFIPLPFTARTLLTLVIILFYTLLSWASIPFVRAAFLSTFYSICALLKLQTNGLYILFLIACIVLLNNPYHLFALDFQLSFLITFIFSWINALKAAAKKTAINS